MTETDHTEEGVNLDGQTKEYLRVFWDMASRFPRRTAVAMFPSRPQHYVTATKLLGAYAFNKMLAMKLRAEGRIDLALQYEGICERLYARLPEFARW